MKKLLAVGMVVVLAVFALAGTVGVSFSGKVKLGFQVDKNGLSYYWNEGWPPYWTSASVSMSSGPVYVSLSSDFDDSWWQVTLDSTPFAFTYKSWGRGYSNYAMRDWGDRFYELNFKDLKLKLALIDVYDDPSSTDTAWFDDVVEVEVGSFDLGVGDLTLAAGYLPAENGTPTQEMGYGFQAAFTGKEVAKDISLIGAVAGEGENTAFALEAKVSRNFDPLSLDAELYYTQGVASVTQADAYDPDYYAPGYGKWVDYDIQVLKTTLGVSFGDVDLSTFAKLYIADKKLYLNPELSTELVGLGVTLGAEWADVIGAATDVTLYGGVSYDLTLGVEAIPSLSLSGTLYSDMSFKKPYLNLTGSTALYNTVDVLAYANIYFDGSDPDWFVRFYKTISF